MFMRQSKSILAAGTFLILLGIGAPGGAVASGLPDYPWDLRRKMPKAYRSYLKILPMDLKRTAWAGHLDGTGSPVEAVILAGKRYYSGSICKPHDCADNVVLFLVEADGSRAVALARFGRTGGKNLELGNPTPGEREYLLQQFAE